MSRPPATNRTPTKDMYWFAHGGIESNTDKCLNQRSTTPGEGEEDVSDSSSPTLRSLPDRRGLPDDPKSPFYLNSAADSGLSSGPSSLDTSERSRNLDKRTAVEERRKLLLEAEQERNDAVLRKHMEREAALEARRNAQRSNIAFAFGSSVPRNVETLQGGDGDKISRHSNNTSGLMPKGEDLMSKSMTAAVPAPRGRRKNDLMPTVPYDRTATPKTTSAPSTRKRSVSMTRLDQLAQPRRHYVEANKASSTTSSGASSMLKDNIKSPTRPLSSASEQSGGSGRLGSSVTRRVRSSPRKPRPVSIAGTVPDSKTPEIKVSPVKKTFSASRKPQTEAKKAAPVAPKSSEKSKPAEKAKSTPRPASTPKPSKQAATKPAAASPKTSSPKVPAAKKAVTNKKKADIMVSSQQPAEGAAEEPQDVAKTPTTPPPSSPTPDSTAEGERNNGKHIISEEEAKAALAEKRRLAREQAEKEAELERQRQEELRRQEEERLRLEEEEQKRMEEETLRLLEEHKKLEEEKLRKAIEENERKAEEERVKREEEQRLKAEQEKKAQEEAEKQRIELEEKLRKEEEERAERKKRLEKIMSRTRGKSSNTSPSGSVSGSEHFDSSENQQENLSSGANSLDSNPAGEAGSDPTSLDSQQNKIDPASDGTSMENHPTYEVASDNESLNDIVMPRSETASQDNSLVISEREDLTLNATVDSQASESVVEPDAKDQEPLADDSADLVCAEEIKPVNVESADLVCAEEIKPVNVESADLVCAEEIKPVNVEESQQLEETEVQFNENQEQDFSNVRDSNQIIDVPLEFEVKIDGLEEKHQAEVVEEIIEPANSNAVLTEATPADETPQDSEAPISNQTDVIPLFENDVKNVDDMFDLGSADGTTTLLPDAPLSSYNSELASPEEAEIEQHSHFSTSSDIKLPDPIYETSDDGSVSSEKHQQESNTYVLPDEEIRESQVISDEVFSEKEIHNPDENTFNPFEVSAVENSASKMMAAYESQFEIAGMEDSIYAFETSEEKPREIESEDISSVPEMSESLVNVVGAVNPFSDAEENKENIGSDMTSHRVNPFAAAENSEYDAYANKENMQFMPSDHTNPEDASLYKNNVLPEQFNFEINQTQSQGTGLDNSILVEESTVLEQNFENHSLQKSPVLSSQSEFDDVTIIRAEGSNECIGIISSVDHDEASNNLAQLTKQNEQLKSNFEYSSLTDSEESSLDSNLSQVMTLEVSEKNSLELNNGETISTESPVALNNGQAGDLLKEPAVNGSGHSKANGDHFFETETLSNGHRIEASDSKLEQISDFVPLDGKHISSVDHSKPNIFDNVDAVDFGKMAPDPFLAKGNSNQISGNPFLLQDDQKQVLMTPDFFN